MGKGDIKLAKKEHGIANVDNPSLHSKPSKDALESKKENNSMTIGHDHNRHCCDHKHKGGGCMGCGYFLGFIGAATYYIWSASSFFWGGVLGILKAAVWPAFLVFEVLKYVAA